MFIGRVFKRAHLERLAQYTRSQTVCIGRSIKSIELRQHIVIKCCTSIVTSRREVGHLVVVARNTHVRCGTWVEHGKAIDVTI